MKNLRFVPLGLVLLLGAGSRSVRAQAEAVERARLAGRVTDETGAALPGVSVRAEARPRGGASRLPAVSAWTDALGSWELKGLPPGAWDLRFELPGFMPAERSAIAGSGEASLDVSLTLSVTADVVVHAPSRPAADDPEESVLETASAASEGVVGAKRIGERPVLRPADVLETVPGLAVTSHSGEGKANQYFLRGFDLDHGTDFSTSVAGMPVNMPSHAHGQGYTDLNFLIPELVSGVQYRKGPYAADQGDFATAGSATIDYASSLERGIAAAGGGTGSYGRALFADSSRLFAGTVLYALETVRDDGPWVSPDRMRKYNAVLRYAVSADDSALSVTAMGYRNNWSATDQVPERALESGEIGRFASVDPTDGGETHRYSLSADWRRTDDGGVTKIQAYAIDYRLKLFSNFTYFLDDPVRGDQFEQTDRRVVTGLAASRQWRFALFGLEAETTAGLQLRNDAVSEDGLFHTRAREVLSVTRLDRVNETSAGLYAQTSVRLAPHARLIAGLREDVYRFRVSGDAPGTRTASLVSPKLSLVLGPWSGTELYANYGWGFHSNDARAAVEPGGAAPLARATAAEIGARATLVPHLQSTLALWGMDLASELVYAGDAGTTESARPSRRAGVEWTNLYRPVQELALDADLSLSRSRFRGEGAGGDLVPGSVETVFSAGATLDSGRGISGSLRVRYFGSRPLTEDGSVRSRPSTLLEARAGWEIASGVRIVADVFNLLNSRVSEVEYLYRSRLPGEPAAGIEDVHSHPVGPRTARLGLTYGF